MEKNFFALKSFLIKTSITNFSCFAPISLKKQEFLVKLTMKNKTKNISETFLCMYYQRKSLKFALKKLALKKNLNMHDRILKQNIRPKVPIFGKNHDLNQIGQSL